MSRSIRDCIKKLNRNENVEVMLPQYIRESLRIHNRQVRLKLMMEYYTFYEIVTEELNPYLKELEESAAACHRIIGRLFSEVSLSQEQCETMMQELAALRGDVTDRMQVITAYVDRFVVYEYLLNRIQYRYEDRELIEEDEAFVQEVLRFIFATKDNVVINDRIRMVIGQLPMRMTRKRYYDVIRESISVYRDGDQSALDSFLYMFRTSAMLYHTPAMDQYFTDFVPVLQELQGLDYEQLSYEDYQKYTAMLLECTERLRGLSDAHVLLQQLINDAYGLLLSYHEQDRLKAADTVIREIHSLFTALDAGSDGSSVEQDETAASKKLERLGNLFVEIEGEQEKNLQWVTVADAVLEEIGKAHAGELKEMSLQEDYERLQQLMQLASGSEFVELGNKEESQLTGEQTEEAAEALIKEIKEAFAGQSRVMRRAIMANTVDKLPVFFSTPQEVADHISLSLLQCEDEAEKYASKQLIRELMSEETNQ